MDECKPLAAGADIVVAHVGLTTAGSVGAATAISLESAAAAVRAMAAAARAESPHCLVLCHGRTVQVDPIKPTLKAPGSKRLKLKYDNLHSSFAFKFNLRRCTTAAPSPTPRTPPMCWPTPGGWCTARAYTRPLFGST